MTIWVKDKVISRVYAGLMHSVFDNHYILIFSAFVYVSPELSTGKCFRGFVCQQREVFLLFKFI